MRSYTVFLLLILLLIPLYSVEKHDQLDNGLYAKLDTQKGTIILSLYYKKAPLSVANFVGLSEGTIKNSEKKQGIPFYDGVLFHRVVNNFVIQTGDPKGDGEGGPGYSFPIELRSDLKHDSPGTLGMARDSNPDSNGSQFYITHRPTPHLDGSYIVFGKVIKGMDTVNKIIKGDKLNSIKILRIGKDAEEYKVDDHIFEKLKKTQFQKNKMQKEINKTKVNIRIDQILALIKNSKFTKTKTGLKYIIIKEGKGEKIKEGETHQAQFTGFTKDRKTLQSSYLKGVYFLFRIESESLSRGLKESFKDMKPGEKRLVIIPPNLNKSQTKKRKEDPPKTPMIYELELIL